MSAGISRVSGPVLAEYTTLRVGGPASMTFVDSTDQLIAAVRAADRSSSPVLILGGGSNVLVGDSGFSGDVIKVRTRGQQVRAGPDAVSVRIAAGEPWDEFVARAADEGWSGVEALSGIPGLVGATPIQNVGAYGASLGHVLVEVECLDRRTGEIVTLSAAECELGYRWSVFKAEPGRFVILWVTLRLTRTPLSAPIQYGQLAAALQTDIGARVDVRQVREAVLQLRRDKGMVLDEHDHDTWSAGSFFTNPILDADAADRLPAAAPQFPQSGKKIKTSAAWLIEHAGFTKGYGTPPALLSTKHTLALTNRGGATSEDLLALAREVRAGVRDRSGVLLEPEPVLVGCTL
jgi:UDP-N-acetylmuramate dehydrogenase